MLLYCVFGTVFVLVLKYTVTLCFQCDLIFLYNVPLFSKYKVTSLLQIVIKWENICFVCFHAMTPAMPTLS